MSIESVIGKLSELVRSNEELLGKLVRALGQGHEAEAATRELRARRVHEPVRTFPTPNKPENISSGPNSSRR